MFIPLTDNTGNTVRVNFDLVTHFVQQGAQPTQIHLAVTNDGRPRIIQVRESPAEIDKVLMKYNLLDASEPKS